jgi:hypothetical protein
MTHNWLPLGGVAFFIAAIIRGLRSLFLVYAWGNSTPSAAWDKPLPPHPQGSMVDGCRYISFDVGSNIGVQVRKLFQPELYPGAKILPHFE